MRLAGLLLIHEWSPLGFEELVIGELARHVEGLFVYANGNVPESWARAAKACPKLAEYREGVILINPTGDYSAATGRIVMRLLDAPQPEMYIYLDADDILPPNVEEIIDRMDRAGAMCVEFPVLNCAGDADHVIASTSLCPYGPHVKLAVWRPGLNCDTRRGFNYPSEDYVGKAWRSPWPQRHLVVTRPREFRRRYETKPGDWMLQPWPVAPYDPKRTWEEWLR